MPLKLTQRRICFVTGTRAEFGLMRSTLEAIDRHPCLKLQIVATGMHLSRTHGRTVDSIKTSGWTLDAVAPWSQSDAQNPTSQAATTGRAMAKLAHIFESLKTDIVLVVGDRVEAFAAASAAHLSGRIVAHVHGGDRALGQVDDALRHAITKLAHIHFPATRQSAERILKLGENRWRIHQVGSPGIDGIVTLAKNAQIARDTFPTGSYALVVLHPVEADEAAEYQRAKCLLSGLRKSGVTHSVIVYPNNDPGAAGIIRCWQHDTDPLREVVFRDIERPNFLSVMAGAALMIGNSSSGIIEAASFGTPVIDIAPRQNGRERNRNVTSISFTSKAIERAIRRIWNDGRPRHHIRENIYGSGETGKKIAAVLARASLDDRLRRKLIAY